ncbi:MAG: hypothetical protein ACI39H_07935 [Lachnospiraceae bacterium]
MGEQEYFREALSNFTYEVACMGAIRHRADLGDSVSKIHRELDFPMSYARVQKAVWDYFVSTGVILTEEPGRGKKTEQYRFVKDQNAYGSTSFRRVKVTEDSGQVVNWADKTFSARDQAVLVKKLKEQFAKAENETVYMTCDFGILQHRDPKAYEELLDCLTEGQREYMEGLPWRRQRCYYKVKEPMKGILFRLCAKQQYEGSVYFVGSKTRILIVR